jgi:hypothetical protein
VQVERGAGDEDVHLEAQHADGLTLGALSIEEK